MAQSVVPAAIDIPASVPPADRIEALDILRGFALLGMIIVHFHQRMELPGTGVEDLIGWGVYVLLESKAWGTFAFLFGVGFAIQLRRFEEKGIPVVPTYLRRLLGLAVFGVIAWVCFGFTILLDYAFWAVPLLLVRNWSTKVLMILAVVSLMLVPTLGVVNAILSEPAAPEPVASPEAAPDAPPDPIAALRAAEAGDDYGALVAARANAYVARAVRTRSYLPGTNLALFLLGLLALRKGLFADVRGNARRIGAFMTLGLLSWALSWIMPFATAAVASPGVALALRSGLGLFRDQLLCLTYIGAVALLVTFRPVWLRRLAPFGEAGRMALTNYMLQIAALDLLGSQYGFGLRVRPLVGFACALALFAVLAGFSHLWLKSFRMGPAEWLWRAFTYLRLAPIRRAATGVA